MPKTIEQITTLAFHLQRLMKHEVVERAELGKDMSLLNLEVLGFIAESPSVSMSEIAHAFKITPPSATSLVNRLVTAGFLTRKTDPNNRRMVRVALTTLGLSTYETNVQNSRKAVADILSVLPKEDQKDMLRIYKTLIQSLT